MGKMNRYVIYTAVVGNYDEIKQPQVVDNRFDYILFSNDIKEKNVGIWQVRPIPYHNPIQTKIARWVKTHPEELLDEYEASLWMDASITVISFFVYERFLSCVNNGVKVATMRHLFRNCAYEEMVFMMYCMFEREDVVLKWGKELRKNKYPRNNGLCETGVFFRSHFDSQVKLFDNLWWNCIDNYSHRDQLSVNYALWKTGLKWDCFISEKENVYHSVYFSHRLHCKKDSQRMVFGGMEAWLIRYFAKGNMEQRKRIEDEYYRIYAMPYPKFWAFVLGQYYRILWLIKKITMDACAAIKG